MSNTLSPNLRRAAHHNRPKKRLACAACKMCPECAAAYKCGITPREFQLVIMVCDGDGNQDIAKHFGISEETVKRHLSNIFDKVGCDNRTALAVKAMREGWVEVEGLTREGKSIAPIPSLDPTTLELIAQAVTVAVAKHFAGTQTPLALQASAPQAKQLPVSA